MRGKFAQDLLEIQRRKSCPAVVGDGEEANAPQVPGTTRPLHRPLSLYTTRSQRRTLATSLPPVHSYALPDNAYHGHHAGSRRRHGRRD